jgi:predicted dehydrogenase
MSEYTAAVVGCGNRGSDHLEAYERIDGARPVACCARNDPRRDELAEEFDLTVYDDAEDMLADEEPDIVHVATPPNARVEIMETVSEAGVPACTVEKPIALRVDDWRAIVELGEQTDTRFAVCHQFRWQPDLVRCREAVESGRLGEVRFLDCSAGLSITDQGTHCLHYANALNGDQRIDTVFATVSGPFYDEQVHPGPDATQAAIVFENGVRCQWTTGTYAPSVGEAEYQHKRAVAYTDRGRVQWEQFGEWAIVGPETVEYGDFGRMARWQQTNIEAQARFHEAMFEWLEAGPKPATNLEHSLHEWKAVLALYASALWRTPVTVSKFEPESGLVERVNQAL